MRVLAMGGIRHLALQSFPRKRGFRFVLWAVLLIFAFLSVPVAFAQAEPVDKITAIRAGLECLQGPRPPDVPDDLMDEYCLCLAATLREGVDRGTYIASLRPDAPSAARIAVLDRVIVPCLAGLTQSLEARRCTRPPDATNPQFCGCVGAQTAHFVTDQGVPLIFMRQQDPDNGGVPPVMLLLTASDFLTQSRAAYTACKIGTPPLHSTIR